MPSDLENRRIPTAVLERDLDRLMAWGLIARYSRATRANGRRSYTIRVTERDVVRWSVGQVHAFIRGAMLAHAAYYAYPSGHEGAES